jgi:probable addiction module antidote protein
MSVKKPKRRAKLRTLPWDPAVHLKTDEDIANYLEAVLEDGDPALIAAALNDIARAK